MYHNTAEELAYLMDYDFDRYPLPICFDPYEEAKAFRRRTIRLQEIAERFYRRFKN